MLIKLLGSEISISTANDVSTAKALRVVNIDSLAVASVNVAYANGTVYANCSITPGSVLILEKGTTDLVTGVANTKAAPIAFKN